MFFRDLPLRLVQALLLIAVLCSAAVKPLKGQEVPDSARVARVTPASPVQATSATAHASSTTLLGPRLSPQFQRVEPVLVPSAVLGSSVAAAAGQHTIVISTLALVLIVIIVVLLVVK